MRNQGYKLNFIRKALLLCSALSLSLLICEEVLAGSLFISWNAVSDSRVAGYKVKYGTTSGNHSQSVGVGNVTSYVLQNLTEGTTYHMVVVAYDANLVEGTPSQEVSGVVLKASNVTADPVAATSSVVSWQTNKPSDSLVEYGATPSYGLLSPLNSTLTTTNGQTLANLTPLTKYYYRVRSRDQGGSLTVSQGYTFTTVQQDGKKLAPPGRMRVKGY